MKRFTILLSRLSAAFAVALLVASCSGGSGGASQVGIGSGGTGGIASGPISGLGSVIVNGIPFDESTAQVTINGRANRPVSELRLGMVVEVRGTIAANGSSGKADTIMSSIVVEGPVSAIDLVSASLTVLGQNVRADASTVLEGFVNFAALAQDDVIEVSGLKDASGATTVATRIERRPAFVAGTSLIEVNGEISALTAANFRIGALTIGYAGATLRDLPASGLANGLKVKVQATQPVVANLLTATLVQGLSAAPIPTGTHLEIEGFVASFVSPANFLVGDQAVNASAAQYVNGSSADLANGKRVEVEGTVSGGILAATRVEFRNVVTAPSVELEGLITDFISAGNFKVRAQLIDATRATFINGAVANLANGRLVKITGTALGSVLIAAQVEFKDSVPVEATRLTVQGLISDFISAANFRVNGQLVATSAATAFFGGGPNDLANGRSVEAEGIVAGGILSALKITIKPPEMAQIVSTEGIITDFASPSNFKVNGQAIAASAQTLYSAGTASNLGNGVRVEVSGTITAGVLNATRIEFKSTAGEQVQVEGNITNFVSPSNFKVAGQVVDASAAVFENGSAADLANGLKVQATGKITNAVLKAVKIEISR